ncbi:hypothetical protein MKW98_020086 [Papaver atlanticum]|uniref:DOG1 domain-containing protein n=1 Tax=Papaver atlanticum TaxID=357466 RepID=A0AAD4S1R2_9MAGN|nr:hypothetical protein MKW98_020086 [Papaver atlanticum]
MPYNINNNSCGENRIFFETFFTGWLIRQKNYLDQLMSAGKNFQNISEMELRSLVFQILTHYQQYYTAKVTAARKDVFVMFAPPWFSSYELTYLWITGFKPSLAFKILDKSVVNQDKLSDEQLEALCRLRVQTKAAERVLNNEMARVQESLALPPLVALRINPAGRRVDGGETVDAAMQTVTKEMEILVESADFLRITTAMKIVEILSPVQSVRFLAAATQLQVNIRMLGLQRDAERGGRSITGSAQE